MRTLKNPKLLGRIPRSGILARVAMTAPLLGVVACGAVADLSSQGGGQSNLNLTSPFQEINLTQPSGLPAPSPQDGVGGVAAGASFASSVGGENVSAQSNLGRFNPNYELATKPGEDRLAWATYWLDMTDKSHANSLILDWMAEPRAEDVWVGLSNWDKDRWIWRKLEVNSTLTPPNDLAPFIRDSDMMLACTILVLGSQQATLLKLGTDIEDPNPPPTESEELLNLNAHLGLNLDSLADYTPSTVFLDVFQTARPWIPQDVVGGPWDNGHAVNTDTDGWITSLDAGQAVATLMMVGMEGIYPSGRYICLYEGAGTLEFGGDATVAWTSPGRIGVDITPTTASTKLRIIETDALNPIRNIRLILPGFENTYEDQIFHPEFLASISDFDVLRFTKWGATVNSTVTTWSDRTTLNSFTQARQSGDNAGVSFERMIDLCNKNLSDAWVSIPHLADDDFVTRTAELFRDRLDPRLRVYVEYSNEVWNSQFIAATYARDQGLALGLSTNNFEAQLRFFSQRSQEMFDLFETVFEADPDRFVRVAAGQGSNPWVGTTILDWDADLGAVDSSTASGRFDFYATAPYFGGYLGNNPQAADTVNMTVTELLDACDADSLSVNGLGGSTEANALNATDRGISLIAYEGGQHLVGVGSAKDDDDLTELFLEANRDNRMRQIYADDMRRWSTSGGGLFVAFSHISVYSKHGSWGILESQTQDTSTAPKWLGLMDWLAEVSTPAE